MHFCFGIIHGWLYGRNLLFVNFYCLGPRTFPKCKESIIFTSYSFNGIYILSSAWVGIISSEWCLYKCVLLMYNSNINTTERCEIRFQIWNISFWYRPTIYLGCDISFCYERDVCACVWYHTENVAEQDFEVDTAEVWQGHGSSHSIMSIKTLAGSEACSE